ncbi:ArdC family protein [Mesorhizobium norvegicum]|uniref:ArdC family protein n=1 Tax=Mesorhizobium sp. 10.2.3 TaxID=1085775 RepID=UPI00319E57E6
MLLPSKTGCLPRHTRASPPRSSLQSKKVQVIGARRGSKTETSAAGPTNVASGRRCRGINTVALRVAAIVNGYSDGLWTPIDNGRTPERRCRFRHVRTGAALAWERLPAHTGPAQSGFRAGRRDADDKEGDAPASGRILGWRAPVTASKIEAPPRAHSLCRDSHAPTRNGYRAAPFVGTQIDRTSRP